MFSSLWWCGFTIMALQAQKYYPGVDFLIPGLIVCVFEEKWTKSLFFGLLWLFIQEGTGTLAFGTVLLCYACTFALLFICGWLLDTRNLFFILLLGFFFVFLRWILIHVLAELQDFSLTNPRLVRESIIQGIIFPLEWGFVHIIYNRMPGRKYAAGV